MITDDVDCYANHAVLIHDKILERSTIFASNMMNNVLYFTVLKLDDI